MGKLSFRTVLVCAGLVTAAPLISLGQTAGEPVATVEGHPIYEQEVMAVAAQRMFDLRNQEFKVKSEALDTLIRQKLLDAEAKRKGLTTAELLKQEVESKIAEPSDEQARGYFLAIESHSTMSFEAVKPQVKQLIRKAEIQDVRKKYEDALRAKADVAILLRPPSVQVAYDPARVRGNPDAPVTIVEFADYQCPFCKNSEATLKAVLAKYDGRVKRAFMDFPLTEIHGQAAMAAEAARCAGEQGKFWEYHDSIFADPSKLDEPSLIGRAQNLHLDESAFRSCLATRKFREDVKANQEMGTKVGVAGTPAYFINGVFLNGAQPQAEFEKIIDSQLAALGNPGARTASASAAGEIR